MASGAREASGLVESVKSTEAIARALRPLGPPVIVFNKSHSGSRVLT
jgi:hypothetical protein